MDRQVKAQLVKFRKNHLKIVKALKKQTQFDCIAILVGSQHTSHIGVQKEFFKWYLGTEFQDSLLVITSKMIFIVAENLVFDQLSFLNAAKGKSLQIFFLVKDVKKDNNQQLQFILERLRSRQKQQTIKMALNLADGQQSQFIRQFNNFVETNMMLKIDATSFLKDLINEENRNIFDMFLMAGKINLHYMKFMSQRIEQAIELNENVSNYFITQQVKRDKSQDLNQIGLRRKLGLVQDFEILNAIVQSGGQYSPLSTESTQQRLSGDVVIYSFCCQYQNCQTFCMRTLLFQPEKKLEQIYRCVLNIQTFAIGLVQESVQFNTIYLETKKVWTLMFKDHESMISKYPLDIGYVIGNQKLIDSKNNEVIQNHMCIVLRIYIDNIQTQFPCYPEKIAVAIGLADTIFIYSGANNNAQDRVITKAEKEFSYIAYQNEYTEDGNKVTKQSFQKREPQDALHHSEKLTKEQFEQAEYNKIKNDQEILKQIKQYEMEVRLNDQQTKPEPKLEIKMDEIQAFLRDDQFKFPNGEIAIDHENSAILIPIRGIHYVFHALTIQSVSVTQINENRAEIQIRFWTNELNVDSRIFPNQQNDNVFIKEVKFVNPEKARLDDIANEINLCREEARVKQIERQQEIDKFDFVIERLKELPKNPPTLVNVFMRPTQSVRTKSACGYLECHENGFRYQSARREVIDFTFTNIKHCFFVSPEEEVIACIHFVFKVPIKSGKNTFTQIQFYREIEGASEQEAARLQSQFCQIDVVFDQKVQKRRREELSNFLTFQKSSEQYYKRFNLNFEKLEKQYAFEGNYSKERVVFQPTKSCLVNIIDHPFFILTLENVDIMCCERVQEETISFDLISVLKDLEAPVIRIEAIDKADLKRVQEWMNKKNILFFQTTAALMWRNMQFSIQKDFPLFVYDGGWATMMKDVMEHAPIQQFNDEPIFEPDSSNGPTSVSEFEFEQDKKNNKLLHKEKDEEKDFSDLVDSDDVMSEMDIAERKQRKKIKFNFID